MSTVCVTAPALSEARLAAATAALGDYLAGAARANLVDPTQRTRIAAAGARRERAARVAIALRTGGFAALADSVACSHNAVSASETAAVPLPEASATAGQLLEVEPLELHCPPESLPAVFSAIREQQERCFGCKAKLERTRLGLGPHKARYCFQTGAFYCHACHTGALAVSIPARVVLHWDFTPYPVANIVAGMSEVMRVRPTLFVGAENPVLFDVVPLLAAIRRLRLQLTRLYEVGSKCPAFMRALTTEDDPAGFYLPAARRHLVEGAELWALAELEDVNAASVPPSDDEGDDGASMGGPRRASQEEEDASVTFTLLRRVRDAMARHVTGCSSCRLVGARRCPACADRTPIYPFDDRVIECSRCRRCLHRACWRAIRSAGETCPGCVAAGVSV